MHLSKIIIPLIVSSSLGSIFGIYLHIGLVYNSIIIILSIIILLKAAFNKYENIFIFGLCIAMFSIGSIWGEHCYSTYNLGNNLSSKTGSYSYFEGVVISNPENKKGSQDFDLKIEGVNIKSKAPILPSLEYGDKVKVYGKLKIGEDFESENGKLVRYSSLLRARNISYLIDIKRFELISSDNGNILLKNIYKLKERLRLIIDTIPSPESGLLFSMVFGGKNSLPENVIDYFKIAGLLHIVVLSGQNLTIVSYIALSLFSNSLGFKFGHYIAFIFIILYAVMGGLEPATIRAALMATILIIASLLKKELIAGRALLVSASIMVLYNPYIFFDDPSFQLSVLAFSGIIYISPIIERWLIIKGIPQNISGYLSAILGAQITVLPYIIYTSGAITPYSFIANFFALFVVGVVTIGGMISSLLGLISIQIFQIISTPLIFILKYIILVAKYISELPLSSVNLNINIFSVLIIYLLIIYYTYKTWNKNYMNPLSIFILKQNEKALRRGNIPWIDELESGTGYDENINDKDTIKWT